MDRSRAAVAGLLLNIGSFWQRAVPPGTLPAAVQQTSSSGILDPSVWAAAFTSEFLPNAGDLANAVRTSADPQTSDARRLALAARLATGELPGPRAARSLHLRSVFSQLGSGGTPAWLALQPRELTQSGLFPTDTVPDDSATRQAYAALWDAFSQEARSLADVADRESLVVSLLGLLEQYAWSVPSGWLASERDVPLSDHARVTAAIAACLTDLDDVQVDALYHGLQSGHADDQQRVAYLVEGDLSGVQRFIYTITARGATPALRGRSFYLQLLTEAIGRYVLRAFELPATNLIYAGGGHFYLIASLAAGERLPDIQAALDAQLLRFHGGDLYCALGAAALTSADFQAGQFSVAWRRVSEDMARAKRRRFGSLAPAEFYEQVLAPQGHGGNEDAECQVCHYEGPDVEKRSRDDDDREAVRKCALCDSLEELGRDLRDAPLIALVDVEPSDAPLARTWASVLAVFGVGVALRTAREGWRHSVTGTPQRAVLYGLHHLPATEEARELASRLRCPVSRRARLTANVAPHTPNGKRATFEQLEASAVGLKRLGVLRMDVDDLGAIFAQGFRRADGVNEATLVRVSSLSGAMSLFFEGWVGELCARVNDAAAASGQTEPVYIIYSGGDDLFIVGAWSALPELASRIAADFQAYTGRNPLLHVSGGLTLHGGKQPLYQAAEDSGDALDAAKALPGKDAFTMFGQSFHWADFMAVSGLADELERIVGAMNGNRALLQTLLEIYRQYQQTAKQHHVTRTDQTQVVWGPYMWQSAYQLSRMAQRAGQAGKAIAVVRDILEQNNFQAIEHVGLAAQLALARTRKSRPEAE